MNDLPPLEQRLRPDGHDAHVTSFLSRRAYEPLLHAGIVTLGDMVARGYDALAVLPNVGIKCREEYIWALGIGPLEQQHITAAEARAHVQETAGSVRDYVGRLKRVGRASDEARRDPPPPPPPPRRDRPAGLPPVGSPVMAPAHARDAAITRAADAFAALCDAQTEALREDWSPEQREDLVHWLTIEIRRDGMDEDAARELADSIRERTFDDTVIEIIHNQGPRGEVDDFDLGISRQDVLNEYPRKDGDTTVLGPEVFLAHLDDGELVIAYNGLNFVCQDLLIAEKRRVERAEGRLAALRTTTAERVETLMGGAEIVRLNISREQVEAILTALELAHV